MASRSRTQPNITRGIPERKCKGCDIPIGKVMYDFCAVCQPTFRTPAYVFTPPANFDFDLSRYVATPGRGRHKRVIWSNRNV
jgi:hypothetical protein